MGSVGMCTARRARVLLVVVALVFAVAPRASAMTLMTEDEPNFENKFSAMHESAYAAAGYMGASWLRDNVHFSSSFRWTGTDTFVAEAIAHGFTPYLTLTYDGTPPTPQAFASICREAVIRYDGIVRHWSVWNEPDHSGTTYERARYGELFSACRNAIKNVDPGSLVYFGELSTGATACRWLEGAAPPGTETAADGLAIHPYQFATDPERPAPSACSGIGRLSEWTTLLARLASERRLMTGEGRALPLLVTEFGYCTEGHTCGSESRGQEDRTRAEWTGKAWDLAAREGVSVFSYYHLVQHGSETWDTGILLLNGAATAVVPALREKTGAIRHPEGDVNGDGLADLVTLESGGNAITYLGRLDGRFVTTARSFRGTMTPALRTGSGHYPIDVADVDGDKRSDLVTLYSGGSAISYAGQIDGSFGVPIESFTGTMTPGLLSTGGHQPVGVADVNGDGLGDLVTFYEPLGESVTYLGRRDGTFGEPHTTFSPSMDSALFDGRGHYLLDVADVDGDGHADLVSDFTPTQEIAVYRGKEDGTFVTTAVTTFGGTYDDALADGSGHEPIAVADVTGDGRADLVSYYGLEKVVVTYPGQADGTFGAGVTSFREAGGAGTMVSNLFDGRAGSGHELATVIDVNGDGRADLVSAFSNDELIVYPGLVDGSFGQGAISREGTFQTTRFNESGDEIVMEKPWIRRRGCEERGCS